MSHKRLLIQTFAESNQHPRQEVPLETDNQISDSSPDPVGAISGRCGVGSAAMTVQPPMVLTAPEWFQFHFPLTIETAPGQTYYLSVKETGLEGNTHWYYHYEVPNYLYSPGTPYLSPSENSVVLPTDLGWPHPFDFAFMTERFGFKCGDYDLSNEVDIDDIVYLINYSFSGGPPPVPPEAGNVDFSDTVDIDDVVCLINCVFRQTCTPCDPDQDGVPDCQVSG